MALQRQFLRRYSILFAAVVLPAACDTPTQVDTTTEAQTKGPGELPVVFYESGECDPPNDPGCDLRGLDIDEMQDASAATQLFAANGCSELNGWFSTGWGDRTRMWDNEITRQGLPLFGDYHWWENDVHLWSGTENFERTLAHELLHWYYGDSKPHDWIYDQAEVCVGQDEH